MAFFNSTDKKTSITELLEDLTHLEINTIVKEGMLATPFKKGNYDTIKDIFDTYSYKYYMVIKEHDFIKADPKVGALYFKHPNEKFQEFKDDKVKPGTWGKDFRPQSFDELYVRLKSLNRIINQDKALWFTSRNYTILRRIASFCVYLKTLEYKLIKVERIEKKGAQNAEQKDAPDADLISKLNLSNVHFAVYKFDFEMETADEVKIKRMRDLGTETILMQTRIGLDGDVITRIEKDFTVNGGSRKFTTSQAEVAKATVIEMHEKHIDISIKYWNSLVNMVKDFVSGLFDNK